LEGSVPAPPNVVTAAHRLGTIEGNQASIERLIRHMQTHLATALDLDQFARIAGISKFHLVRVFDEMTGTTPRHFLACLRMQRAKQLLLEPGASITDVCFEVGYSSLGTFSKTFSELVGVSPQDFRALPKRLSPMQFAKAVWGYLGSRRRVKGERIEGVVEGSAVPRGFTFVGAFSEGVPQGAPFSGTVLLRPGKFCIERPDVPEFHLLAAFIPLSADLGAIVTTLPIGSVASLRVRSGESPEASASRLALRPLRLTDPPIVMALPALPPWKGLFAGKAALR
jgi:AraC-like DNA-binding protein